MTEEASEKIQRVSTAVKAGETDDICSSAQQDDN